MKNIILSIILCFATVAFGHANTRQNVNDSTYYINRSVTSTTYHLNVAGNIQSSDTISASYLFVNGGGRVDGPFQASNFYAYNIHSINSSTLHVYAPIVSVPGKIKAKEIIVNSTGADFVFADDYKLRPLKEVKSYIAVHRRLPEIPSAKEMQEKGMSVEQMVVKLLQKVEELTLYNIQLEERINELENNHKDGETQ